MPPAPEISITFVGDIMPAGCFSERWEELRGQWLPGEARPWFDSDVVFANLECVASNAGAPLPGKIVTYAKPQSLEVLRDLRCSVVNLANNHQMDYGIEASEATRAALDSMGIAYGGVGRTLDAAREPVILERHGMRIGFLFYSWTAEFVEPVPAATEQTPGVSPLDLPAICEGVRRLKADGVEVVMVSLHWGEGKSHHARPENVAEARAIVDAGADAVIGHHTHCLQGWEMYKGRPIFYGLGNFFCSAYRKRPDKRLTYDPDEPQAYRYRFERERRTMAVKAVRHADGHFSVAVHPLYQLDDPPVLTIPAPGLQRRIERQVARLSRRLHGPLPYAKAFAMYRRMDELKRVWEDFRETGWQPEYAHPRTWLRVCRKLLTAKSYH